MTLTNKAPHTLDGIPPAISNYIRGWTERNAKLIANAFSPTGIYIDAPHPTLTQSNIAEFLTDISWRNFPDMTFNTLSVYGAGDRYTWEWVMQVSSCGVIAGSLGRPITVPGVDLLEMKGNVIEKSTTYFDRKALWDAVLQ